MFFIVHFKIIDFAGEMSQQKYFYGITKNCKFALTPTYAQHSLNMASQKKQLVLDNIDNFALEASMRPHMNCWRQHVCETKISKCASANIDYPNQKLNPDRSAMHLDRHTPAESEHQSFCFSCQNIKIIENTQWFLSQMDCKVFKTCNTMQYDLKMASKTLIKPMEY